MTLLRFFLLILLSSNVLYLQAQTIRGRVLDAGTNLAVNGANVYVNNSRLGTISAGDGSFSLPRPPAGAELIISSIGYETQAKPVDKDSVITILLKPKVNVLEIVVLEPTEPNGWERYGAFFMSNFIGQNEFAQKCVLVNTEALRFRFKRKQNRLEVFATDVLLLRNEALGYQIRYDLQAFEHQYTPGITLFSGFAYFTEMEPKNERTRRKWEERRAEAYYGSSTHFLKALFRNRILEEGFTVQRLQKIQKQRSVEFKNQTGVVISNNKNRRTVDSLHAEILVGDSIAYAHDSVTAVLDFPDYLQVAYAQKEPRMFAQSEMRETPYPLQRSLLRLTTGKPVLVLSSGSYYHPGDLLMGGLWGWNEKMANLLPLDYVAPAALNPMRNKKR